MRILDRIEEQNIKANAALDQAFDLIEAKMKQEPRVCGLMEAGMGCACTGACHTDWYNEAQQILWTLKDAKLPKTYNKHEH